MEYKYSYFVIKKAGDVLYRLILQRLASIVGILFVVTIGTFVLIKLSPIDPVSMKFNLVGATPDPVVVAQIREQLGLNDPWWQQYLRWLGQIVQGDFGESILYALPVATILGGALPNTLGLVSLALVMGIVVTIPLGMLSAKYQDSWIDHGVRLVTFLALAIPGFWVGLLLLYLFGVKLQLVSVTNTNGFSAYVLPAVTLALWICFVQGARALGLPEWMVYTRYIFPHVGLMLLPMMGVTMGAMLGGSAVIETVFSIKGIGYMMVQGIMARDYVLMQGYIIWITLVFIVINIIIDVLGVWLNPKRRVAIKGGSYE
ncbi:MAG: ABC transporter permease [Veillonella sp.]|nr:ABC transporter permease [Veillonella sp.]